MPVGNAHHVHWHGVNSRWVSLLADYQRSKHTVKDLCCLQAACQYTATRAQCQCCH